MVFSSAGMRQRSPAPHRTDASCTLSSRGGPRDRHPWS